MKAIPDLDFAARHINKPAVPPKPQITIPITSTTATSSANAAGTAMGTTTATSSGMTSSSSSVGGEQLPGKVQLAAQKLNSMEGAGSHRGSGKWSCKVHPAVLDEPELGSEETSSVSSGSQRGSVSYGETLQVSASAASSPQLPVSTRLWRQPRPDQELEGEEQIAFPNPKLVSVKNSLISASSF